MITHFCPYCGDKVELQQDKPYEHECDCGSKFWVLVGMFEGMHRA